MPEFSFSNEPPPAVRDYFAAKGLQPSFDWRDVWGQEHAFAFTVAKATELDVLTSIQNSLQRSLNKGGTFADWKKNLTPELQRLGWWGRAERTDPLTGEVADVQLGSPRRLKTIWRTNMRTARAAGQWERGQSAKAGLPYYLYQLGPSEEHRPDHAAKEGLILRVDDPFWTDWFPPNGWGCKCWLRQITEAEALSLGYSGVTAPTIPEIPFENERTGERVRVPRGIDPGFAHNPGKTRADNLSSFLAGKLSGLDENMARAAVTDLVRQPQFTRHVSGKGEGFLPVAAMPDDLAAAIGSSSRLVRLSHDTAIKQAGRHPDVKPTDWRKLQEEIHRAAVMRETTDRLIFYFKSDDKFWRAVVKTTSQRDELYLTTFHRTTEAKALRQLKTGEVLQDF